MRTGPKSCVGTRKLGKDVRVRIADRARREEVFEVPGRSQATTRTIPPPEKWVKIFNGSYVWEKTWESAYDPDDKIVIEVGTLLTHYH